MTALSDELAICAEAARLDMTDEGACRASGQPEAISMRRIRVQRLSLVVIALICMGICGQTATAQDTGNAQNSGNGQQTPPAQKPEAAKPATPAQDAGPAQEPAATAAESSGIVGKWHFVLETPGGDRETDAELAVDPDGKVTGKFGAADVAGKYKDGELDLDFPFTSDELGETAEMKFSGKLDRENALTGTWEFITYSGTFKATRPKAQG